MRDENGVPQLPCTFQIDGVPPMIEGSFNVVHGLPCEPAPSQGNLATGMPKPVMRFCVS
jgi:hypothetical protein